MVNIVLHIAIKERFRFQADFARAAGLSEDRASRIVTGRIIPKSEEMKKIAEVLEISEFELFPHHGRFGNEQQSNPQGTLADAVQA